MAIIQKNLYLPGQDLTNLAQNVDYNRYQDFKGTITVNFGTVPATVTVKVGTILEVNGNLYAIETADYVFSMDNATHNYLTFTDNPGVDFGSAAAIGTYSAAKQGYYQAGNLIRTLPFYINQTSKEVSRLMDEPLNETRPRMKQWTRVLVYKNAFQDIPNSGLTTRIVFNLETYDELSEWNTVTSIFTANEAGWYLIALNINWQHNAVSYAVSRIEVDGVIVSSQWTILSSTTETSCTSATIFYYLNKNSTITFSAIGFGAVSTRIAATDYLTTAMIQRII